MSNKWRCSVCKYIVDADEPPKECPECKGKSHKFKPIFKIFKGRYKLVDY